MNDTWLFLILIVVVAAGIAVVVFLKKSWDKKSAAQGFESNPLFNRIAEAARTAQPTHVVVTADGVTLLNSSDAFMLSEGGELTKLPQGRVKDVRDLNSWDNAVLKRFSTRIVSADRTCLTYFDFAQEGYRYEYPLKYDAGNMIHGAGFVRTGRARDYSDTLPKLGQKASHGCTRVSPFSTELFPINMYWLWIHLPYHTRVIVLDD